MPDIWTPVSPSGDRWTYPDATVWRITEDTRRIYRRITAQGVVRIVKRRPRAAWTPVTSSGDSWVKV
jgi:hypothetical protein